MIGKRTAKSCFIIGPMKDSDLKENARLRRLSRNVIEPLLRAIEKRDATHYIVRTPYDLGGDFIMRDVIHAIDRADIVVADLTDNNPNVFYELGIIHALGRPCISVVEESQKQVQFDLNAYRFYRINLEAEQYTEAREILSEPIERAHRESDWAKFENPVIDFFRAPITYISPAYALAQGYYLNFVRPVFEAMIFRKGRDYIYDIGVETDAVPQPRQIEEYNLLDDKTRGQLELHIIIPGEIAQAKRNYADKLRGHIPGAVVEGNGRTFTCFYRESETDQIHALVDLPTTIRVMEDAVARRTRHLNTPIGSPEWKEIEEQEITRFELNLRLFIQQHEYYRELEQRVKIFRYDPDLPIPADLNWLHQIMIK
ncbi:MAG: hypothetical protein H6672_16315 [Anaerolineaceae bacterium]|nr:hypothetical protein [Anaerolineaceae bacterium]